MWQEFFRAALLIVASLFPIINPPAAGFLALGMIPDADDAERADLARAITINSIALLMVSLLLGAYVLAFFGISQPALRVAGGLIVAMAGWRLLQAPDDKSQHRHAPHDLQSLRLQAFYPLTLPLTVGSGAIAVAIALGTSSPKEGPLPAHVAGVAVGLLVLAISIYVCVRYAGRARRILGDVGTQVMMRLFAFIIFCIGIQMLWVGIEGMIRTLHLAP
ncbi:MarC family protein [Luteibacter sp. Lutesp34]|uniref:MarC family protein n=1 Tax=Luteibacter sp. Lutesp34 TaxID=3243030 RepID=UPI0039B6005A